MRDLDRNVPSLKVFWDLIFKNESPPDTDMTETRLAKKWRSAYVVHGLQIGTILQAIQMHNQIFAKTADLRKLIKGARDNWRNLVVEGALVKLGECFRFAGGIIQK